MNLVLIWTIREEQDLGFMGLGLTMDYKRRVGFRFYEPRTYVDSYRRVVFRVYRPRVNIE